MSRPVSDDHLPLPGLPRTSSDDELDDYAPWDAASVIDDGPRPLPGVPEGSILAGNPGDYAPWQEIDEKSRPDRDGFVPIDAKIQEPMSVPRQPLIAAAVVTGIVLLGWLVAEIQYARDAPWPHWATTWYAFALLSILAIAGWIVFIVRWMQRRNE